MSKLHTWGFNSSPGDIFQFGGALPEFLGKSIIFHHEFIVLDYGFLRNFKFFHNLIKLLDEFIVRAGY